MRYEIANVGARISSRIAHTQKLNIMKYNKALGGAESIDWAKQVAKKHGRMLKDRVWKPILRKAGEAKKTITSTWAMKKRQMKTKEQG